MAEYSTAVINAIMMRDSAHSQRLGKVLIRANQSQDPYYNESFYTMLPTLFSQDIVSDYINHSDSELDHDMASAVTTNLSGGQSIANTLASGAYSWTGSWDSGYFSRVGAHEWGHSWGAVHTAGGGEIEGPTIMKTPRLRKYSSPAIAQMLEGRSNNLSVPTNLGPVAPPLPPHAGDDLLSFSSTNVGQSKEFYPLENDNDVNGEAINIVSTDASTSAGNSIVIGADNSLIVSGQNVVDYDWFRYVIEDESGQQATGTVHIEWQE